MSAVIWDCCYVTGDRILAVLWMQMLSLVVWQVHRKRRAAEEQPFHSHHHHHPCTCLASSEEARHKCKFCCCIALVRSTTLSLAIIFLSCRAWKETWVIAVLRSFDQFRPRVNGHSSAAVLCGLWTVEWKGFQYTSELKDCMQFM